MKRIETSAELIELVNGFRVSRVILTAVELRLFDLLEGKSCSSADLATLMSTDPRATDRLMNVLAGAGLLEKQHGLFTNSGFASRYMVSTSPSYLGGLGHTADLWRKWSTLTQVIRKGSAMDLEDNFNDRGPEWLEKFIAAMHARGMAQGRELASMLDLSGVKRSLDVGGGSGAFTFGFVEKNPGIQGVVYDLPNVVPITEKYIQKTNNSGHVATLAGDYLSDELGKGYDLVLMSAIIHINSVEENLRLVRKGTEALNPGGQLVIMDHLMSDDRTEPFTGALFALNMLVGTRSGDSYTLSEISDWMKDAGLSDLKNFDLPSGGQFIVGFKS
jgi:SAM-dependent methyltransferase